VICAYEPLGNRLVESDAGTVTTYRYDATNAQPGSVAADGTVTTNTFDASGNQVAETTGSSVTTSTWDGEISSSRSNSATLSFGCNCTR